MEVGEDVENSEFFISRKLNVCKKFCSTVKTSPFCNQLLIFFSSRSEQTAYNLLSISARKSWILSSIQKLPISFLSCQDGHSVFFLSKKGHSKYDIFVSSVVSLQGRSFSEEWEKVNFTLLQFSIFYNFLLKFLQSEKMSTLFHIEQFSGRMLKNFQVH